MRKSELNRFLNHIEREQSKTRSELENKLSMMRECGEQRNLQILQSSRDLEAATSKIAALESEIAVLRPQNEKLISAARSLLPKIRVNIYSNSTSCTPRWFESGKWWSRETGGLDPDFVSAMTADEIHEAVNFYGTTELPLMLPKSHRQQIVESEK